MSRSAFSARVFAVYLLLLGALLIAVPNLLLTLFRVAPTTEVWIHVVGVLVMVIGAYLWLGSQDRTFLAASVVTRTAVFLAFLAFALLEMVSPMLVLFGAVDLAGGIWTWWALRADDRSHV